MVFAFEQARTTDATERIDCAVWEAFRAAGLAMAPFDEGYGGAGLSDARHQMELCTVLRLLGSADLSIARLFEGHVNAIALVARYGLTSQLQGLAKSVAKGALSAVWGADDASGLKLAEGLHGRSLRGRKILASGAGFIKRPIVTATAGVGQVMCLLDLSGSELVDISEWQAQGMRATATGTIDLSGVPINDDHQIGVAGDFMRQPFFSAGSWRFCAAHVGAMERLVDLFRSHLRSRLRGDDLYQLQRVAQSIAGVKTARFWVEEAARRFGSDELDADTVVAFSNLTRMVTERSALDLIELVQRGVGLPSFVRPHPIERISRDLGTYLRQPVPDLAMSDGARIFLRSSANVGDF